MNKLSLSNGFYNTIKSEFEMTNVSTEDFKFFFDNVYLNFIEPENMTMIRLLSVLFHKAWPIENNNINVDNLIRNIDGFCYQAFDKSIKKNMSEEIINDINIIAKKINFKRINNENEEKKLQEDYEKLRHDLEAHNECSIKSKETIVGCLSSLAINYNLHGLSQTIVASSIYKDVTQSRGKGIEELEFLAYHLSNPPMSKHLAAKCYSDMKKHYNTEQK